MTRHSKDLHTAPKGICVLLAEQRRNMQSSHSSHITANGNSHTSDSRPVYELPILQHQLLVPTRRQTSDCLSHPRCTPYGRAGQDPPLALAEPKTHLHPRHSKLHSKIGTHVCRSFLSVRLGLAYEWPAVWKEDACRGSLSRYGLQI